MSTPASIDPPGRNNGRTDGGDQVVVIDSDDHDTDDTLTIQQRRLIAFLGQQTRTGHRLDQLVSSWLAVKATTQTSRDTYGSGIRKFFTYCAEKNFNPLTITGPDIDMYGTWLQTPQARPGAGTLYAYNTRRRLIIAASSFYTYLVTREVLDRTPFNQDNRLKDLKEPAYLALTPQETDAVIADADTGHRTLGPRCARLALELAYLGLRAVEICSININDVLMVDQDDAAPVRVIRYWAKGNKRTQRAITAELDEILIDYLAHRPNPAEQKDAHALLLTLKGKRLKRFQLNYLTRRAGQRAGITRRVTPHGGRHTYVRHGRLANVPEDELSRGVGHANLATTGNYGHVESTAATDPSHRIAAFRAQRRAATNPPATDTETDPSPS